MPLIPPHGGLSEPVNRTVEHDRVDQFVADAAALTKVPVSDADLSTVYRLGDGGLSPLTGPMDRESYERVLDEAVIERDGTKYAWTIPLALPVSDEQAGRLGPGEEVALVNSADEIVARLKISDVFPWDKQHYLESVYLTERTDHPGGDMVLKLDDGKSHLIGGEIEVLRSRRTPSSASTCSRRARYAHCSTRRAGIGSSPSRRATPCTAPTSTRWCTAWRHCSARGTMPGRV